MNTQTTAYKSYLSNDVHVTNSIPSVKSILTKWWACKNTQNPTYKSCLLIYQKAHACMCIHIFTHTILLRLMLALKMHGLEIHIQCRKSKDDFCLMVVNLWLATFPCLTGTVQALLVDLWESLNVCDE